MSSQRDGFISTPQAINSGIGIKMTGYVAFETQKYPSTLFIVLEKRQNLFNGLQNLHR